MDPLQREIARRDNPPVTLAELTTQLKALGYKLDRFMDCRSIARWVSGPAAGETYPCVSLYVRQIDDGLSAFNVDARRDDNFKKLQELRGSLYAVNNGAIYEI